MNTRRSCSAYVRRYAIMIVLPIFPKYVRCCLGKILGKNWITIQVDNVNGNTDISLIDGRYMKNFWTFVFYIILIKKTSYITGRNVSNILTFFFFFWKLKLGNFWNFWQDVHRVWVSFLASFSNKKNEKRFMERFCLSRIFSWLNSPESSFKVQHNTYSKRRLIELHRSNVLWFCWPADYIKRKQLNKNFSHDCNSIPEIWSYIKQLIQLIVIPLSGVYCNQNFENSNL